MSRIGKKVIIIPTGVDFSFDEKSRKIRVKGSLGESELVILSFVSLTYKDGLVSLNVNNQEDKFQRSMWGTTRSLILNMIEGVSNGLPNN
jgi:large subunit ribosomal protein L6